jgi:hypothetical protein
VIANYDPIRHRRKCPYLPGASCSGDRAEQRRTIHGFERMLLTWVPRIGVYSLKNIMDGCGAHLTNALSIYRRCVTIKQVLHSPRGWPNCRNTEPQVIGIGPQQSGQQPRCALT